MCFIICRVSFTHMNIYINMVLCGRFSMCARFICTQMGWWLISNPSSLTSLINEESRLLFLDLFSTHKCLTIFQFLSVFFCIFLPFSIISTSLAIREMRVGEVGAKRRQIVDVIYGLPPPLFMPKRSSKVWEQQLANSRTWPVYRGFFR